MNPKPPKKLHSNKYCFPFYACFYVSFTHLNIWISDPLDMPVPDLLVPYLQRLAPYAVQDGQEPGLEGVLEHVRSRTELFLGMFHFSPSEFQGLTKLGKTGRQVLERSS